MSNSFFSSNARPSHGLADGLDPARLHWEDIAQKPLHELIKLNPAFTTAKNNNFDLSFEALVKAAGNKKLEDFTLQDVSALTIALAHNITHAPCRHDAPYASLMREIWRNKSVRFNYETKDFAQAGVPRKDTFEMSFSEMNTVARELDHVIEKLSTVGTAQAKNEPGRYALKENLMYISSRISGLAKMMDDREDRQDNLASEIRKQLIGVSVRKWSDKRTGRNDYRLSLPPLRNSTPEMETQHTKLHSLFKGHGVDVAFDFDNNCRFMFVTPKRGSDMDVVLHALSKEGHKIGH